MKCIIGFLVSLFLFGALSGCESDPVFTRVEEAGLPRSGKTFGCTWADMNGDGRLDMFLSRHGRGAEAYLSRGDLGFELLETDMGLPEGPRDNHAASAIDFDCDGDWDLYVSAGANQGRDAAINDLMIQEAPGVFLSGLDPDHLLVDRQGRGRGSLWVELDGDRYPELLLTHYLTRVRLFHQDGADWSDWSDRVCLDRPRDENLVCRVSRAAGADLDRDGHTDLFIASAEWGLLHNPGDGQLQDVTRQAGLRLRNPALAEAIFIDMDYDGDQDLLVAYEAPGALELWRNESDENGLRFQAGEDLDIPLGERIDSMLVADLDNDGLLDIYVSQFSRQGNVPNLVARGLEDGGFEEPSEAWGLDLSSEALPSGAWALDLDYDGDLDLVQVRGRGDDWDQHDTVDVMRNNTARLGFTLRLESRDGPPHGLGAQVELELDGRRTVQQVNSRTSYYNSTVLPLHFGVKTETGPFTLQVRWPDGHEQEVSIPSSGAAYLLREGEAEIRVLEPGAAAGG